MSKEESISINGPAGALQAIMTSPTEPNKNIVAVICHPHPLHGGTMNNKVVTTITRTCRDMGICSVRFNFRGVGDSEGEYGEAIGEADDLVAVLEWVKANYPGVMPWLIGFSFGSYVAYRVAGQYPVAQLVTVAPSVEHFDFASLSIPACPWLVIQGGADEVVPPAKVREWVESLAKPPTFIYLPEVGHFFHGKLVQLSEELTKYLNKQL